MFFWVLLFLKKQSVKIYKNRVIKKTCFQIGFEFFKKIIYNEKYEAVDRNKKHSPKEVTYTLEKSFFIASIVKCLWVFFFRQSILWSVFFTFLEERKLNKYCLWEENLVRKFKFILKSGSLKCWLCFRLFLWRTQK